MATINPYVNFFGNAAEAMEFYKSVFGGEFVNYMHFKDMPDGDKLPETVANRVMHAALPIGNTILMAGDVPPHITEPEGGAGRAFAVAIGAASEEEAQSLYNGLSAGGAATMPLHQSFWGDTFGMLTDKFGIEWIINYNEKYQQQ